MKTIYRTNDGFDYDSENAALYHELMASIVAKMNFKGREADIQKARQIALEMLVKERPAVNRLYSQFAVGKPS